MDNNNQDNARNLQRAAEGFQSGVQARGLMLLAEQATAAPPNSQVAPGPSPLALQGNGQAAPTSNATVQGVYDVMQSGLQDALQAIAQQDTVPASPAVGRPISEQQGSVPPPATPAATGTADVTSGADSSDWLLQAIHNAANGANGNPPPMPPPPGLLPMPAMFSPGAMGMPGAMPSPGLLGSPTFYQGSQLSPGYFPSPLGWDFMRPSMPTFQGAFSAPAVPWTWRFPGFQPSPFGYGMMPPPMPPLGASGSYAPPPTTSAPPCATLATGPPPATSTAAHGTPTPDLVYVANTPTPERLTNAARDAWTPDSDVEVLPPPPMRCMAARRAPRARMQTPPSTASSPVAGLSTAMRSPPAVSSLEALQASCNRILAEQKKVHANAGFEPERSSESEPTTTPPSGPSTVGAAAPTSRLRDLLTAPPPLGTQVRIRVRTFEAGGRPQFVGPPSRGAVQRSEATCGIPVGMVRGRVERLSLLNPPSTLRAPSAAFKRKATDAPTGPPRKALASVGNQLLSSQPPVPRRQWQGRGLSEHAGNDENLHPPSAEPDADPSRASDVQPLVTVASGGARPTMVERAAQTMVQVGVMGGSADWMFLGGTGLNNDERRRAEDLRNAYAARMGYGGRDVSPELLLQWARDCVEFLRRIRADPLAFSYIFGLLKRWLSRPVPSYGLPRAVPYDDATLMQMAQQGVGIARGPATVDYAVPLFYGWIMRFDIGIMSARRAAALRPQAGATGPQDPDEPSTSGL